MRKSEEHWGYGNMSKINRIRIMNLNYNGNTIRVDDETFDLAGKNTLLSLRNGGGKSVLVQMVISLFVNKSYRDFPDRPFRNYFTTNRPTLILTEWKLDQEQGYFLAGMMVRKCQNLEENNNEELEMLTFTGSYKDFACTYSLENFPVIEEDGDARILKGFGACKKVFEELKKERATDFNYYDMSSAYFRKGYFSKLREYQIDHKEWETIIKKVNLKESGLSELFANAKDEKGLIENWFLDAIEKKINQEQNRIEEFRDIAYKYICQFRENQTKIERKDKIEKYFEDAGAIKEKVAQYEHSHEELETQKEKIAVFIQEVYKQLGILSKEIDQTQEDISDLEKKLLRIQHEKVSYQMYGLEDKKRDKVADRLESEALITSCHEKVEQVQRELCKIDCAKLYQEAENFRREKESLQEQLQVLQREQKDNQQEIEKLGKSLFDFYNTTLEKETLELGDLEKALEENHINRQRKQGILAEVNSEIADLLRKSGTVEKAVQTFDEKETKFQQKYHAGFGRNILGKYEDGTLELWKKKYEDENTAIQVHLVKLAEKEKKLTDKQEQINREEKQCNLEEQKTKMVLEQKQEICNRWKEEQSTRRVMMQYVDAPEEEFDQKAALLERFERKIKELELLREEYGYNLKKLEKEYANIRQGKVVQLPENILGYFSEENISVIYGMEWLKKNGRMLNQNKKLVEKNPLLPFCIILEKQDIEKLADAPEELVTGFPIPILEKEQLEETVSDKSNNIITLQGMRFFVMFNKQLLDEKELERILEQKKQEINVYKDKIQRKESEIRDYRNYQNIVEQQSFTQFAIDQMAEEIEGLENLAEQWKEKNIWCMQQRKETTNAQKENKKEMSDVKEKKIFIENRQEAFEEFCRDYRQYEMDLQEQSRIQKKIVEKEKKKGTAEKEIEELQHFCSHLKETKSKKETEQRDTKEQLSRFQGYESVENSLEEQIDVMVMEARFKALTAKVIEKVEELEKRLQRENGLFLNKQAELRKRNQYDFLEEEYVGMVYSDAMQDGLVEEEKQARKNENQALEKNNTLSVEIARLDSDLENIKKELLTLVGRKEWVPREEIVELEFDARWKLSKYEKDKKVKILQKIEEKKSAFENAQSVMAEYVDFQANQKEQIYQLSLSDMSKEELNTYHGKLRIDLKKYEKNTVELQRKTEAVIRKIYEKAEYQEEFFQKGYDNLMSLTEQVDNLKKQLYLLLDSYDSMLQKLKVDLELVEKERTNLEEFFLEYVQDINENMEQIDRNSTISIRGKSLKMLKIKVPDWEEHKTVYQLRLRDYVEQFLKWGIEAIETEKNVEELLGKLITTKKLYDEVVGMGNVAIRMYKIEAEREVAISWAEVSANSGGEGFLSAFVILSCLLSYMRRDDTDLFAMGEEGKVLIMDNPFAQTNAVHLLKPLMEMAEKTNTQLICLSGLGGDSIYNRFDNIYVLNLVQSSMRNHMQYMSADHLKGEDIKTMMPSEFKMEQIELEDFLF